MGVEIEASIPGYAQMNTPGTGMNAPVTRRIAFDLDAARASVCLQRT
jgi:hypothetical protein